LVYNIAIVGAGSIGKKRAESLSKSDNCQLKITADINKKAAIQIAQDYGGTASNDWHQIVNRSDIDIVIVSTFNKFLAPICIEALNKKKHVLCEKPLGRNSLESQEILEASKENNVILKTGFNHRHHPAIAKAKSLSESGSIGAIYFIRCIYGHGGRPGYEKEWRASKDLCGGGELLDQGVHVIDLFRWFLGEFKEVYGSINTFHWKMEVEDNAFAMFKTRKGQTAIMHTSWTQWKNRFSFEIYGEKGYLIVDGLGGSYGTERLIIGKRKKSTDKKGSYLGGPPDERILEFPGPDISWSEEWKELISSIEEKRESLGSGYDGLLANKLISTVYESAKLNRPVRIQ